PETAAAGPGMRVRVRFSGKDAEGIVLERCAAPSTDRPVAPLPRLVSEDVVVPPAMMRVSEDVAARCAGTVGDVLRLALPPRHARAATADRAAEEKEAEAAPVEGPVDDPGDAATDAEPAIAAPRPGDRYTGLPARPARAGTPAGPSPPGRLTLAAAAEWPVVAAGGTGDLGPELGALVVARDRRAVARLSRVLTERGI